MIRKPDLSSSMSQYLIDQIASTENIEVLGQTEITEVKGNDRLSEIILVDSNSKEETRAAAAEMIAAWQGWENPGNNERAPCPE